MADSEPRKTLRIKLYYPRSLQREPSTFVVHVQNKKRKLVDDDSSMLTSKILKTLSRIVYEDQCEMKKDCHSNNVVIYDVVSAVATSTRTKSEKTEQPAKNNRETKLVDSRRTGSEEFVSDSMDSHVQSKKRKLEGGPSMLTSSKILKTHSRKVYEDCKMKDSRCKNVTNADFSAVATTTRTKLGKTEKPAKNRGTNLDSESRTSRTRRSEEERELLSDSHGKNVSAVGSTTRSIGTRTKWGKTEQPAKNRETKLVESRTGSEESAFKCKKVVVVMERFKKMRCWAILKRMMIGKDGWAFKHPLDPYDSDSENGKKKKPILGFVGIESKLLNWIYSEPDQFADDIRNLFSHALLYPPRSEVHRIGRRLSENFEMTWKSLKNEWASEDRKQKRRR